MIITVYLPFILHYSIEKKVKDTVRRAFWDAFQAKLDEDPPDFSHALVLIEEVKDVCCAEIANLMLYAFNLSFEISKSHST